MRIKSEEQYKQMKSKLEKLEEQIQKARASFQEKSYPEEMIHMMLLPTTMIYESTKRHVREYEDVISGRFNPESTPINKLGSHLIKLRIYRGLSEEDLAKVLGIKKEQVIKDERHEYAGSSMEKIYQILQTLGVEKITILPSDAEEPEFLRRTIAMNEMASGKDEISATREAI